MCGITGWFDWTRAKEYTAAEGQLRRMCDVMVHRGPDQEGSYITSSRGNAETSIALGMRRLSIIDLSTGNQPIRNEDGSVWLVCNGEIYNFQKLRDELIAAGHRFYTKSDVEVIVHLYEDRGFEALQALRGMFAFALWDSKKDLLFIARDRLGKKPLTYTVQNGALVFGSEMKTVMEYQGISKTIDPNAIDLFLTYQYIPSPHTIYRELRKLPPASYLVCDGRGNVTVRRYWELDYRKKLQMSLPEWEEAVREKLREATKLRMISDVPLGAFLSGGIDSSAVVAMMAQESSRPVQTFSIGFAEQDFSELSYARQVAKHLGTDHHEFVVKPHTVELLPKLVWHYDEPYSDSSALPSYYVAQEAKRFVTVALNGDGGDESFAGYLRYRAFRLSERMAPVNRLLYGAAHPLSGLMMRYSSGKARTFFHRVNRLTSVLMKSPAEWNVIQHSIFDNPAKDRLYSSRMKELLGGVNNYAYMEEYFDNAPADNNTDRLLYADVMTYLPECLLVKVDIATMANSLEGRSPLLDHELVELAAGMPAELKLHGLENKFILKQAFRDILPKNILYRQKQGFGLPVGHWFRGELKGYLAEMLLSPEAVNRGYFEKAAVERLIREHNDGTGEHAYRLWALLMLELWHRVCVDKSFGDPRSL